VGAEACLALQEDLVAYTARGSAVYNSGFISV
jgi:hypothetical protein